MLSDLYTTANYRMEKGHFNLRMWNTNCEELKTLMIKGQKFVEHGCQLEKFLGYKYSTLEDTLQISGSPIGHLLTLKEAYWPKLPGFSTHYLFVHLLLSGAKCSWEICGLKN